MTDVFLSYAKVDARRAASVARALQRAGLHVWWDEDLPTNRAYSEVIEERLRAAAAVLVLWSEASVASQWVRAEADLGRNLGTLTQASLDGVVPPIPFNQIQCADLKSWRGGDTAQWRKVLESVNEFVQRGPRPPGQAASRVERPRAPRRWLTAAGIAVLVVALGVAAFLGRGLLGRSDPGASPHAKVAFAGIAAPPGDPTGAAAATAASAAIVQSFTKFFPTLQIDGLAADKALEKARSLNATYLVWGEVSHQADKVTVHFSAEDTSTEALFWSDEVSGPAADPQQAAAHAAARLTDILGCVRGGRTHAHVETSDDLHRLVEVCLTIRDNSNVDALVRSAELQPHSADAQAMAAIGLFATSQDAPTTVRAKLRAMSLERADAAERLDPNEAAVQLSRVVAAIERGASLQTQESLYKQGLRRDPTQYTMMSWYSGFLLSKGRIADALPLIQVSTASDPLSSAKRIQLADTLLLAGRTAEAAEEFRTAHLRNFSTPEWVAEIAAAIFDGAGTVAPLLKDTPNDLPPGAVDCWRDLAKAEASSSSAERAAGARRATACQASGAMPREYAMLAVGRLGDPGGAFALQAPPPDDPSAVFFDPGLRALRADPRFLPFIRPFGVFSYWKQSGKRPDFCQTEKNALCEALR